MSPPPLENVVAAPARVQGPLTLSDTWTCPVESYWANHPTIRSPARTAWPSGMVTLLTREPVETEPACTEVIDPGAVVVACTGGDDWGEWLPAPSTASTV